MIRRWMTRPGFWWSLAVAWALLIFGLSSRSDVPEPGAWWMPPHADKLVHALLFAVLAWAIGLALLFSRVPWHRAALIAFISATTYGAIDEWHQRSVPGRSPDVLDWVADTVGAASVFAMRRRGGVPA